MSAVKRLCRRGEPWGRGVLVLMAIGMLVLAPACQSTGGDGRPARRPAGQPIIRRVACLYDHNPWLNLDREGDRDVEGFQFRVFLDAGSGKGIHAQGILHIEIYKIGPPTGEGGTRERTLVSDWHYPISEFPRIAIPGMLGEGYMPRLVWADKDLAGSSIDVIVSFEDAEGNIVRASTKHLRIPKYIR